MRFGQDYKNIFMLNPKHENEGITEFYKSSNER